MTDADVEKEVERWRCPIIGPLLHWIARLYDGLATRARRRAEREAFDAYWARVRESERSAG